MTREVNRANCAIISASMRSSDLTSGERLLVYRRRLGESQSDAADRLGLTMYRYRMIECASLKSGGPPIGKLASNEACYIKRVRARASIASVAAAVGVSEWWVTQMERGRVSPDRLLRYWESRLRAAS